MKKLNLFDLLAAGILLLFVAALVLVPFIPRKEYTKPAQLRLRVVANHDIIKNEASKKGKVYLNGINVESNVIAVNEQPDYIDITIDGKGEKKDEVYIFNGARVLVGKKAELHGSFFAQGIIADIKIDD